MSAAARDLAAECDRFRADFTALRDEVGRVVVGQRSLVDGVLVALVAGGHVLIEGVPGLGKTLLAQTVAAAAGLGTGRISCTPDLMPADVTGTDLVSVDDRGAARFTFRPGPVFANVFLADEINRATPKTQSALLEAMQEGRVTAGGATHDLPRPFCVLATQNPLEQEGTYPLPEAQLDRFFVKLLAEFPSRADLAAVLDRTTAGDVPAAEPVLNGERLLEMRVLARDVPLPPAVRDRAAGIILATHPDSPAAPAFVKEHVRYGAGPRGAQALVLSAKVRALLDGRFAAAEEDVAAAAADCLRHRVGLTYAARGAGVTAEEAVAAAVAATA